MGTDLWQHHSLRVVFKRLLSITSRAILTSRFENSPENGFTLVVQGILRCYFEIASNQNEPLELQTRAPWAEVKSARMTESCLAGVQKAFCTEGPRVSQKSLAHGQPKFAPVQPHVAPLLLLCLQRPFAPSPKHFGADQLIFDFCPWRPGLQLRGG